MIDTHFSHTDVFRYIAIFSFIYIYTWKMACLTPPLTPGQLASLGMRPVLEEEDPDVVLLNTCSIRDKARFKPGDLGVL